MPVDSSGYDCPGSSDQWTPVESQKVPASHFIGTFPNTPLTSVSTIPVVSPDQEEQEKALQQVAQQAQVDAQLAQHAARLQVEQQAQLDAQLTHQAQVAQQDALLGNCVGINGAPGLVPQPGHMEVTKYTPPPVETLSEVAWQKFRRVLEDHGPDPDAGDKIESGQLKFGYKPMNACHHMERRYESCPYDQWDWDSLFQQAKIHKCIWW